MKNYLFCLLLALCIGRCAYAQLINNKGNRQQTYPKITETNSQVKSYLEEVSVVNLENDIRWMQNLGCRDAQSQEAVQTQNWLMERLESYGLDVYLDLFACENAVYLDGKCTIEPCDGDTLQAGNVVAIQYGTDYPDEFIVVSCHYDHQDGPGADDNASGTAGVLECARIMSKYQFKRSIIYVCFNAEEYWMVGSFPFVERCAEKNMNILGCFNLDMLGFYPERLSDLRMFAGHSLISENLFDYYQNVTNLYQPDILLDRFTKNRASGDAEPFNVYEYPAIYIGDIEYISEHPCYHKDCDTLGHGVNRIDLVEAYTKSTIAATMELANGILPPQKLSAIQRQSDVILSWSKSEIPGKYKLYKNGSYIIETVDTFYIDKNFENDSVYEYYVEMFDNTEKELGKSNVDKIIITNPLTLPYSNDFENSFSEWKMNNSDWKKSLTMPYEGNYSLTNGEIFEKQGNLYSVAELNWFSVPDIVKNISVSFYLTGIIQGFTYKNKWAKTNNMFLEATTDRKNWDKLARIEGEFKNWEKYNISLNKYIGNPFVQLRFRIESLSDYDIKVPARIFIDNFKIDFEQGIESINTTDANIFDIIISPNPSGVIINIETGLKHSYKIEIYNINGILMYRNDDFLDGSLDLSRLSEGIYIVKVSTKDYSIARRIIKK